MSDLTIEQALRAIAERTPFRTEEERRDVLAAIDRGADDAEPSDPEPSDPEPSDPEPSKPEPSKPARGRR